MASLQSVTMRIAVSSEQIQLQQIRVSELIQSREMLSAQLASVQEQSGLQNSGLLSVQLAELLNQQQQQQQSLKIVRTEQSTQILGFRFNQARNSALFNNGVATWAKASAHK